MQGAIRRRRAQLVLLLGEAGVGKTRLVEELVEVARREHRAKVLHTRCVPYGEANAWWPVAETLRQAANVDRGDSSSSAHAQARAAVAEVLGSSTENEEVVRVADGLLHLMGYDSPLYALDPVRARADSLRSTLTYLEGIVRRQPLVLALSDLQWAEEHVLDLLDRLLDRLRDGPLVVLATARPDVSHRWGPRPGHHDVLVVHVEPLDETASSTLLASLLDSEPSAEVRELLLERSGGNPLYLEELVALLKDAEMGGWRELEEERVPATLRGLVSARLDALSPAERSVLEDAAVLGRTGPLKMLFEVAATRSEADPETTIHNLLANGLLSIEDGSFAFKSDLVREIAYGTLTKAERARRHASLAAWLAARARALGREDEEIDRLAYHFAMAAELDAELGPVEGVPPNISDRAASAIAQAAQRAERRHGWRESARLWDQAAQVSARAGAVSDAPDDARSEWRRAVLGRARARAALGETDTARVDADTALKDAELAEDLGTAARALNVLGQVEREQGHLQAASWALTRAVALAREADDPQGMAEALVQQAVTSLLRGDCERAEESMNGSLRALRGMLKRRGEAWALPEAELAAIAALGRLQAAKPDEALARATWARQRVADQSARAEVQAALALALLASGDTKGALDAASELERAIGASLVFRLLGPVTRGFAQVRLGEPARAKLAFEAALAMTDRTEDRVSKAIAHLAYGCGLVTLGQRGGRQAMSEASRQLDDLGAGSSWQTVFELAAGPVR